MVAPDDDVTSRSMGWSIMPIAAPLLPSRTSGTEKDVVSRAFSGLGAVTGVIVRGPAGPEFVGTAGGAGGNPKDCGTGGTARASHKSAGDHSDILRILTICQGNPVCIFMVPGFEFLHGRYRFVS